VFGVIKILLLILKFFYFNIWWDSGFICSCECSCKSKLPC